jgi:hypothetical protein
LDRQVRVVDLEVEVEVEVEVLTGGLGRQVVMGIVHGAILGSPLANVGCNRLIGTEN